MTPRRTLFVFALWAFFATGCDSNDDSGDDRPDRVILTEVTVEEFPDRNPDGDRWDEGTDPSDADLYFDLLDADTDQVLASGIDDEFANVDNDDTPLVWDANYESTSFGRPLVIVLYDRDPTNNDDYLGETREFDFAEAANDDFRRTLTVTGDDIEIRLRLEWE